MEGGLEIVTFEDGDACPICLESFDPSIHSARAWKLRECHGHFFHATCITAELTRTGVYHKIDRWSEIFFMHSWSCYLSPCIIRQMCCLLQGLYSTNWESACQWCDGCADVTRWSGCNSRWLSSRRYPISSHTLVIYILIRDIEAEISELYHPFKRRVIDFVSNVAMLIW